MSYLFRQNIEGITLAIIGDSPAIIVIDYPFKNKHIAETSGRKTGFIVSEMRLMIVDDIKYTKLRQNEYYALIKKY